jgi:hypothetical protein
MTLHFPYMYLRKNLFSNSVLEIYHGGPNNLSLSRLLCKEAARFIFMLLLCAAASARPHYTVLCVSQHRWLNAMYMYMHNRSHGYNLRSTPPLLPPPMVKLSLLHSIS